MDIRQFILTSYLRWGCYRHLHSWTSTQQRPVQTQAHANTYHQWGHAHTVPFYGQLTFPRETRDISLLHGIQIQPKSYSLGSFLMDNMARAWSWPLTPSGIKVKNVWSRTSTLSQAFMAWRLLTNRKKFSWFQTFTMFFLLYAFFWVIPRRLYFICRRFGTLCSIFIGR